MKIVSLQHAEQMRSEDMPLPWDTIICESCSRGYQFHAGPKCGCQAEQSRHMTMWTKSFKGVCDGLG